MPRRHHYQEIIDRFDAFARAGFQRLNRVSDVCESAAVNQRTVARAFRAIYKTTPLRYLHSLLLAEARRALLCGGAPSESVTRIVMHFGCHDDRQRQRADSHLFWRDQPGRDDGRVLLVGCGTSRAAKYALPSPRGAGDRIDVGTTSIEKTESLEHKYRLNKLETHQLPVERAADLDLRCEHVVSTGVLWHLSDPDAGLRALGDMLAPSEAMQLAFCGPYGRACIRLLRTYCRQLGIGSSAQDNPRSA